MYDYTDDINLAKKRLSMIEMVSKSIGKVPSFAMLFALQNALFSDSRVITFVNGAMGKGSLDKKKAIEIQIQLEDEYKNLKKRVDDLRNKHLDGCEIGMKDAASKTINQLRNNWWGEKADYFDDDPLASQILSKFAPDDLISQSQASLIAGVSIAAISNAIRDRRLVSYRQEESPAHKPGGNMVSRGAVQELWSNKL